MKTATISELKEELSVLPSKTLQELCLRLARYKKENKDLLTYMLFEAQNEQGFISAVKKETEEQFAELPKANWHGTKKSLRKILRSISRRSKHSGIKESEVEMLLHFCQLFKDSGILDAGNKAHISIYNRQIEKLNSLVQKVHEDLQFDYNGQIRLLQILPE